MRIRWRSSALVLAFVGLVGAASPPCAFACSCVQPEPLAKSVDAQTAVVVGWVGAGARGMFPFTVERWFAGPQPTAVLTVQGGEMTFADGTTAINTCGRSFQAGQHLVLVGAQNGAQLETSICSLGADVASPEGQQLIADAQQLFGPGIAPEQPEAPSETLAPTSGGDGAPGPGLLPLVLIGGSGLVLAALAGAAIYLLLRQRRAQP